MTQQADPMTIRLAKILLPLMLAAFAFIVTFDNIVDYGSNFLYVQHVLSMDTTFSGNALMDRAITSHAVRRMSYVLIIAEGVTCLLLLCGSLVLWRTRRKSGASFNAAKSLVTAGCVTGFAVWFFGFMAVGGGWFCHVAVGNLEWAGRRVQVMRGDIGRADFCQPTRYRPALIYALNVL